MEDIGDKEPHLRQIFDKRSEFDMIAIVQDNERQTNLQALAKVLDLESSALRLLTMCINFVIIQF